MSRPLAILPVLLVLAFASDALAHAQTRAASSPRSSAQEPMSPPLSRRAEDVIRLINGDIEPSAALAPSFLAQAPAERVIQLAAQLRSRYGRALEISSVDPVSATEANIVLLLERGQLSALLQIEANDEARIEGLLFERPDRGQRGR